MLSVVLGWLGNLLGGPFAKAALDAYKAKLDAGNTKDRITADMVLREQQIAQREAELNTEYKKALIGHWYEPIQLLSYIMVIYVGKVVVYDKVFAYWTHGTTDPIGGNVGEWAGLIIMFLVGKRGVENALRIMKRG